MHVGQRVIRAVVAAFGSGAFALLGVTTLLVYALLLALILVLPRGDAPVLGFAEQFRLWCFAMDPATGSVPWGYVVTMLASPLLIAAILGTLWARQLAALLRRRPGALPYALLGSFALCGTALGALALVPGADEDGELPFPAEALRTSVPAHDFELVDQDGRPFRLAGTSGRVVLLTAVYSACGSTCPRIMAGASDAVAALTPEQRALLTVVGVTLDPAHDVPEVLRTMVESRGLDPNVFRFVTGDAATVESVLDRYSVSRSRDPETGVIEHANLFVLIDRDHEIAYRLTIGDRQQRWLVQALRMLLDEAMPRR